MNAQSTPLLLIVGMHRSGTSLLGSLLPACGIAMPGPLISGDIHNPEGYFERADVTALQEQLLIDLERWWPAPRGMQPLPEGWLESARGQQALADLIALLRPEAEHQQGPWAIKDPRSSLLLPLWKAACQQLGIPLKLLLAVRDPAEVMVSLVRRDQAVTGMDGWRAQRLWWHHNAQVLRDGADLPLQVVSYSHWFNPTTALEQLRQLAPDSSDQQRRQALQAIRPEHRRSRHQPLPRPMARVIQQLHQRLDRLALQPRGRHRLERWLDLQSPLPAVAPLLRRRSAFKRRLLSLCGHPPSNQVADHPWGPLAEVCCGSQGPDAEHLLAFWLEHGIRNFELERFRNLPGACPNPTSWPAPQGIIAIQLRGCQPQQWCSHAWLQHCPIQSDQPMSLSAVELGHPEGSPVGLNLADLSPGPSCAAELLHLSKLEHVWDPNPQRVQLLRQFGINASWLQPTHESHGPLKGTPATWATCAEVLGLPNPLSLRQLGTSLCLGSGGAPLDQGLEPPLLGIPGFDRIAISEPRQAQLLAQWLQGCLDAGLELIRFQVPQHELELRGWEALLQPLEPNRAPILFPEGTLTAADLKEELHWYRTGATPPAPCTTPRPGQRVLLEERRGESSVAVCISLYNYAHRVEQALQSAFQQNNSEALELIVVDDASTDHGAALVQRWLEQHGQRFSRVLLLQHTSNGGLASARNTAFTAADSPWCFVLDADNQLDPSAVAHCGALATGADPSCAVIHSLIRVQAEAGSIDARQLVSDQPWQRDIFKRGNYIDAMALVRRSAWEAVGGYTHIPGGWEDFDFWCCLIDAGWHGVLCPQVLSTYTSHAGSMRNAHTANQERRISRLLQSRHPWLELPQCRDQTIAPTEAARPANS